MFLNLKCFLKTKVKKYYTQHRNFLSENFKYYLLKLLSDSINTKKNYYKYLKKIVNFIIMRMYNGTDII